MSGLTLKERVMRACALLTLIHTALGEDDLLKVLNQDAVQAGLLIASREAGELLAPLRHLPDDLANWRPVTDPARSRARVRR